MMLIGSDVVSTRGSQLRKTGERTKGGGVTYLQLETGLRGDGIWYNVPLRTAAQLGTCDEEASTAATFELLVGAVESRGASEAFASEDQAQLTM